MDSNQSHQLASEANHPEQPTPLYKSIRPFDPVRSVVMRAWSSLSVPLRAISLTGLALLVAALTAFGLKWVDSKQPPSPLHAHHAVQSSDSPATGPLKSNSKSSVTQPSQPASTNGTDTTTKLGSVNASPTPNSGSGSNAQTGSSSSPSSGGSNNTGAPIQSTNCTPSASGTMTNTVSHLCNFPDITNSGVQAGATLRLVPGQISSGPGWSYNASGGYVEVKGNGATLSHLLIDGGLDVSASNVTINNVQVVTSGAFGVSFRHTSGDTLENSTVSGTDSGSGRVDAAIADVYGDSTSLTIENDNLYWFRSAVQLTSGFVSGNYIHDPGYISGDHTNGIIANMGSPLTISGNTILNSQGQTDCVTIDDSQNRGVVSNRTITGNLLAGGGYPIYGGAAFSNTTSHIVITNNHFSKIFFANSGQFGIDAYYNRGDPGNVWSGNVWDDTGQTVQS